MKKIIFVILIVVISFPIFSYAGDPPPVGGDPTTDPGATPIGGSAPIGSGLLISFILVSTYLIFRFRNFINLKLNAMKSKVLLLVFLFVVGSIFSQTTYYRTIMGGDFYEMEYIWESTTTPGDEGSWSEPAVAPLTIGSNDIVTVYHDVLYFSTITVNGQLIFAPGSSLENFGGSVANNAGSTGIILQSDATGCGVFVPTGTTNATRQVYLSGNVWHLIGSPVHNASIDNFTGCWMQQYNTSDDTWTWNDEPGFDNTMDRGYGYSIYSPSSQTYSISGSMTASDVSPVIVNSGNGYNLVSNPYICGLSWNSNITRSNIGSDIYVWNSTGGSYNTKAITDGYVLPSMQGFFVKATGSNPLLTLKSGNMTHACAGGIMKEAESVFQEIDYVKIQIDNTSNSYFDEVKVAFENNGTQNYNYSLDYKKLYGVEESPDLYIMSNDGQDLVRKTLPLNLTAPVQLNLKSQVNADYELSLSVNNLSFETDIYLEDLFEGQTVLLDDQTIYSFSSNAGDDENRFLLHFNGITGLNPESNENFAIFSSNNNLIINAKNELNYSIQIVNLLGQELFESANLSGDQRINMNEFQNTVIIVNLITETGIVSEKIIIK